VAESAPFKQSATRVDSAGSGEGRRKGEFLHAKIMMRALFGPGQRTE